MRTFTKILAGSAAALSLASFSAPANAAIYLDFAESLAGATATWTRATNATATTNDDVGGTLIGTGQVFVNIYNNALTDEPISVLADFNLSASDATKATQNNSVISQWEVNGNFSFKSVNPFIYNGINYAAGTNILSAAFTGADLGGVAGGRTGSLFAQHGEGGATVNFTSSILSSAAAYEMDTINFSLSQLSVPITANACTTPFQGVLQCTNSLPSFTSNIKGTFSAAIPEPGTWALMILGFGGAGATLRSRRKVLAAA